MNYDELIAMALKGRSVNSMAKAWGLPQPTLDSYVKGKAMPDFDTALKIAREAGAPEKEAWEALAERTRIHRASKFKLQRGLARAELVAAMALAALAVNLFLTPTAAAEGKVAEKTAEYKLCEVWCRQDAAGVQPRKCICAALRTKCLTSSEVILCNGRLRTLF